MNHSGSLDWPSKRKLSWKEGTGWQMFVLTKVKYDTKTKSNQYQNYDERVHQYCSTLSRIHSYFGHCYFIWSLAISKSVNPLLWLPCCFQFPTLGQHHPSLMCSIRNMCCVTCVVPNTRVNSTITYEMNPINWVKGISWGRKEN